MGRWPVTNWWVNSISKGQWSGSQGQLVAARLCGNQGLSRSSTCIHKTAGHKTHNSWIISSQIIFYGISEESRGVSVLSCTIEHIRHPDLRAVELPLARLTFEPRRASRRNQYFPRAVHRRRRPVEVSNLNRTLKWIWSSPLSCTLFHDGRSSASLLHCWKMQGLALIVKMWRNGKWFSCYMNSGWLSGFCSPAHAPSRQATHSYQWYFRELELEVERKLYQELKLWKVQIVFASVRCLSSFRRFRLSGL